MCIATSPSPISSGVTWIRKTEAVESKLTFFPTRAYFNARDNVGCLFGDPKKKVYKPLGIPIKIFPVLSNPVVIVK